MKLWSSFSFRAGIARFGATPIVVTHLFRITKGLQLKSYFSNNFWKIKKISFPECSTLNGASLTFPCFFTAGSKWSYLNSEIFVQTASSEMENINRFTKTLPIKNKNGKDQHEQLLRLTNKISALHRKTYFCKYRDSPSKDEQKCTLQELSETSKTTCCIPTASNRSNISRCLCLLHT